MPGPLPQKTRRRTNEPTIPTTNLPLSGRQGPAPSVPTWMELGKSGSAWWRWAWSTPQAAAWGTNVGQESMVARRASLEDDLTALAKVNGIDVSEMGEDANLREMRAVIANLASLATGKLQILREMRELDDRLGLTPKGMAALRWVVVQDTPAETPKQEDLPAGVASMDRRSRLTDAS